MTKKYRLRWINDMCGRPSYIAWFVDDFGIDHDKNSPIVMYSQSELDTLKRQVPRLAPAIDAMKEPVEGDND